MAKTNKTQEERYRCWKFDHCPYCGSDSIIMEKTRDGYHATCRTCKASNHFKDEKIEEWKNESN